MKKFLLMLGMMLAVSMPAAEVFVTLKKGAVYQPQKVEFWRNLVLTNGLNRYHMTFQLMKPHGTKGSVTLLSGLHTRQGFCAMVKSLNLKVNGIPMEKIHLGPEKLVPFEREGYKGITWKMNFNGARVSLTFSMRPDSGVLWCELTPDQTNSLVPIRTAEVSFACVPSMLRRNEKGHSIFHEGYQRKVKTPTRICKAKPREQPLTPEDRYLIFYDKLLDGTSESKGFGPCMLLMDTIAMEKGKLHLNNAWCNVAVVNLKSGFKTFRFGIWNSEARISNADFMKKVATEKAAFAFD